MPRRPDTRNLTPDELARHARFIRSVAVGLLHDDGLADDVVQETMLRAWQEPPTKAASLTAWLRTVATRFALRQKRSAKRRLGHEQGSAHAGLIEGDAAAKPTVDVAARTEIFRLLSDSVLTLPETSREVVLLRFYEGLDPAAIALRLSISLVAVRSRLRRAIEELRSRLHRTDLGRDRDWRTGLMALCGLPADGVSVPVVTQGLLMSAKAWAATAAVLFIGLWFLSSRTDPSVSETQSDADRIASLSSDPSTTKVTSSAERVTANERERLAKPAPIARFTLTGRVVDGSRHPVSGARVDIELVGRSRLQGLTTDGGHFEIESEALLMSDRGSVLVTGTDGRGAGLRPIRLHTARRRTVEAGTEFDIGTVVLGETCGARIRVVRGTAPIENARVVLRPIGFPLPYTWEVHRWEGRTDANGELALDSLIASQYRVDVFDNDESASKICDVWPGESGWSEHAVEIDFGTRTELRVRVNREQTPVANVRLQVLERVQQEGGCTAWVPMHSLQTPPTTDANGATTIAGLHLGQVLRIRARAEGMRMIDIDRQHRVLGVHEASGTVVIQMAAVATQPMRWPIVAGEVAPPPDGTEVSILRDGTSVGSARIEAGTLIGENLPVDASPWFARGPEGILARLPRPATAISFRRPRTMTVELRGTDGTPLIGWPVTFQCGASLLTPTPIRTDERGQASVGGLFGGSISVHLDRDPRSSTPDDLLLGTRRVDAGDAQLVVTRAARRIVTARVFVDDTPRLPPRVELHPKNGFCTDLVEDPSTGTLRFALWPTDSKKAVELDLYGPWGYSIATATLPARADSRETVVDLRMERRATVRTQILPPTDGLYQLRLERRGATESEQPKIRRRTSWSIWSHCRERHAAAAPAPVFSNLRPGFYRLRDAQSGVAGEAVEVLAGGTVSRLVLDLTRVVVIEGRVLAPTTANLANARIAVDGKARAAVRENGTFALRLDLRAARRLSVVHPDLDADQNHGHAMVSGPTKSLQLTLVPR